MTSLPPSEFGGRTNRLGIQPAPHVPTAAEKLRAVYRTGDETESAILAPQTENEAFLGLLTEAEQRAIREAEGVLEKGQAWEEMQQ